MAINGVRKLTERGTLNTLLYTLEQGLGPTWYNPITRKVMSDSPNGETHGWIGGVPAMQQRKGDPQFAKMLAPTFYIPNIPFTTGITIPKEDWIKDRFGVVQAQIAGLSIPALEHPGELVISALLAAESTNCYDGQFFFDTDHSEGSSGTQDNDLTYAKAGTLPTVAEMKAAILKAISAMWTFKDDKGRYCNLSAKRFMVGVSAANMMTLLELIGVTIQLGGTTGILNGNNEAFQIVPQLIPGAADTKVYVIRMREPDMGSAFVHQILLPSEPIVLGLESEYCKLNGNLLFQVQGTYNVGYGRWQDACLVTFTGP